MIVIKKGLFIRVAGATVRGQSFISLSLSISLQSSLRISCVFFGQRIIYIQIYYFPIETHELENVSASLDDEQRAPWQKPMSIGTHRSINHKLPVRILQSLRSFFCPFFCPPFFCPFPPFFFCPFPPFIFCPFPPTLARGPPLQKSMLFFFCPGRIRHFY